MITAISAINIKSLPKVVFKGIINNEKIPENEGVKSDTFEATAIPLSVKLAKLDGIHCPSCGAKMMSEEKYKNELLKAEQIRTPDEYRNLLRENADYLPPFSKKVLLFMDEILAEKPDISQPEFLKALEQRGIDEVTNAIDSSIVFLEDKISEELYSADDVEKFKAVIKAFSDIKKNTKGAYNYNEVSDVLYNNMRMLDTYEGEKIYNKLKSELKFSMLTQGALKAPYIGIKSPSEVNKHAFKRLFKNTVAHATPITSDERLAQDEKNSILICGNCDSHRNYRKTYYLQNEDSITLTRNMNTYLEDIVQKIGTGELDESYRLVPHIITVANVTSKGKIYIPREDIAAKIDHLNAVKFRIDFPLFDIDEDVPCANCGTPMINISKKLEISAKIRNAKNPKEINEIIKEYKKYINPIFSDQMELIDSLVEENPNITSQDVMEDIQLSLCQKMKENLRKIVKEVRRNANSDKGTESERKRLAKFADALEERYLNGNLNKYFSYDSYRSMVGKTSLYVPFSPFDLYKLTQSDFKKFVAVFNRAYPTRKNLVRAEDDQFKAYISDVFRMSGLTVDHFVAKDRAGDSTLGNLIAMCKFCNAHKSNLSPFAWVRSNPDFKTNLPKQLRIIDKLVENGELPESFNDYSKKIAVNVNYATKSQVDLRSEFHYKKHHKKN